MTGFSQVLSPAGGQWVQYFSKVFPQTAESATVPPILQVAREVVGGADSPHFPVSPCSQPGPEQSQGDPAANARC